MTIDSKKLKNINNFSMHAREGIRGTVVARWTTGQHV